MTDSFNALIYILSSLFQNLRTVYIVQSVSLIQFLLEITLFGVALRYLVKVPSTRIGGLKSSYDRKLARKQSTPKK